MATDPRKRQKKLERRSAKRKEKKHTLVQRQNVGLAERMAAAADAPILHCWVGDSLADQGLGSVLLSRELPHGQVAVAVFLVDRYCLGVKDAIAEVLGHFSYDSKYVRKLAGSQPMHDIAPADARKLVEGAIAYARGLGLSPHPDAAPAMRLFGSVDAADSDAEFEFGKDGKPFFIAGPNDTPQRCRQIVSILNNSRGQGRFDYVLPTEQGELPRLLEVDDQSDEADEDAV
jgi:hypothetical protein